MKTYNVHIYESIHHVFQVEANSKKEAEEEFNYKLNNGEIDFSYGELYDSHLEIIEQAKEA
jgi:hypothetical protein